MKSALDLAVRYGAFLLLVLMTACLLLTGLSGAGWSAWLLLLLPLSLVGAWDLCQHRHTLLRNYPLVGHARWAFELARPYLRQYMYEGDLSGRPYNREQRSLVYERAKGTVDSKPFGSDFDFYDDQYELMTHSIAPRRIDDTDFRVRIGGPQCTRPYEASLLNVSAMSFGALGAKAIEALNRGAATGGFYQDTGEGGDIRIGASGITTQNPNRQRGLVVAEKYLRVANFHRNTLQRLGELVGAAGLGHPADLRPHHLHHRTGPNSMATMDRIKDFLEPGILLSDPDSTPYAEWWAAASADSFQPQAGDR